MSTLARILLTMFLVQILGAILGVVNQVAVSWPTSLQLGGGMATPFGFALGLLWLFKRAPDDKRTPEETAGLLFCGLLAVLAGASCWLA